MIDAGDALRIGYKELLKELTYKGQKVTLYDLMASNSAQAPYVILGPWIENSDNTKDTFGQDGEINLDVVTRFKGDIRSTVPAAEIAKSITELLKPSTTGEPLKAEGFNLWKTVIRGVSDLSQTTSTDTIIRKIITVSHSLEEL